MQHLSEIKMASQKIIKWVKWASSKGYSRKQIHKYLIKKGLNPQQIREILGYLRPKMKPKASQAIKPVLPEKNKPPAAKQKTSGKVKQEKEKTPFKKIEIFASGISKQFKEKIIDDKKNSTIFFAASSVALILLVSLASFWAFSGPSLAEIDADENSLGCRSDADCPGEQKCANNECTGPECGDCQYIDDYVCVDYECCYDEDCDDGNEDTISKCINPGTINAECVSYDIEEDYAEPDPEEEPEKTTEQPKRKEEKPVKDHDAQVIITFE